MADTVVGFAVIGAMTDEQYRACKFPGKALMNIDLLDVTSGSLFTRWMTVPGLAKGNGFQVRGRFLGDPDDLRLEGYEFSVNVPNATVGNNAVLVNGVPSAAELSILMLKCWLYDRGCSYFGIDSIELEDVRLSDVTNTFLHRLPSREQAHAAREAYIAASEIRNKNRSTVGKGTRPRAFSQGTTEDRTGYVIERTHKLPAYVKDRETESEAVFANETTRHAIFDEAETYLRIEAETHEAWLKKNKLTRVEDWRLYGDDSAYRRSYALIRKALRLDEGLRSRKPKAEDLAKLGETDRAIVIWHLDDDVKHAGRNHPLVLAKKSKIEQQKFFSAVKRRVLRILRVDLSVAWKRQAAAASSGLEKLLVYPGMYSPPPELADHVFSPRSVQRMLHQLRVHLDRGRPRSIGRLHIPPELRAPPLVPLGRLMVSPEARQHLNIHRRALLPLLEAHQYGVFGDVSLERVIALTHAAAEGQRVESRYNVDDKQIVVTTAARSHPEARDHVTIVSLLSLP